MWAIVALIVLLVCPGLLAVLASADSAEAAGSGSSGANSALSALDVRDHDGVPLSSYMFVSDHGGLFSMGNLGLWLAIGLLFAIWLVVVAVGTWLPNAAMDFGWLRYLSGPLEGVANALSAQIATPAALLTAATIGSLIVAWFVVRGMHAKAGMQIAAMVFFAVIGPLFLAHPLAEAIAPDGLLAQGRDLGISVAAGLHGNNSPDPTQLIREMQADMAENFARKPLQLWNYGHVVDDSPSCRSQWSAGMKSGDDDRVRSGLESCGDHAAATAIDNPSFGQFGAGFIYLLSAGVLLWFGARMAIMIVWAALDTMYYGFLTIFGLGFGAFIYGPTQTFTVRCLVHGFVSAGRMAAFIILLAIYELILGNLFDLADGQLMYISVLVVIIMFIAGKHLTRLNDGLNKGNDWIANRVAVSIQDPAAKGGAGGGKALGMGSFGVQHKSAGQEFLATLGAINTISGSPPMEWLAGKVPGFLHPQSREKARMHKLAKELGLNPEFSGLHGASGNALQNRILYKMAAKKAAEENGGVDTVRGAAAAIQGVLEVGGLFSDSFGAMDAAGFRDRGVMFRAMHSRGIINAAAEDETMADKDLSLLAAAVKHSQSSSKSFINGDKDVDADMVAANFATLQVASRLFVRSKRHAVTLGAAEDNFLTDYFQNPTAEKMKALQHAATGNPETSENPLTPLVRSIGSNDQERQISAGRLLQAIGHRFAGDNRDAVNNFMADVTDPEAFRALRQSVAVPLDADRDASGLNRTPWSSNAKPRPNANAAAYRDRWTDRMRLVQNRLD